MHIHTNIQVFVPSNKFNRYIFYRIIVAMMRMCKEVVIKIVVDLKIVDGSQKKFTFLSV